jgi:hypothetical protein
MQPTSSGTEPAPIVQKTYEATLWLIPKVGRFPRSHRFTIGDRIANRSIELLETLAAAAYSQRQRGALLDKASQQLNGLRYLLRLAKDVGVLSVDSYGHASGLLEEIGRMLGGWQKFEMRGKA